MNNLAQSEVFSLTLVSVLIWLLWLCTERTRISLLHPAYYLHICYYRCLEKRWISNTNRFRKASHWIHFLLGPSVVALGYVLYEQIQYLKGNVNFRS